MAYDPNHHWVKVTVSRPEEIERVHAAISTGLDRKHPRPPVDNEILVEFFDVTGDDGADLVREIVEEEFGSPDWIRVEVGHGILSWIYGPYPEGHRYLHEVMVDLLASRPDGMTATEIAGAVAADGTFIGPRSSHTPEPKQISARASGRRDLFESVNGRIRIRASGQ